MARVALERAVRRPSGCERSRVFIYIYIYRFGTPTTQSRQKGLKSIRFEGNRFAEYLALRVAEGSGTLSFSIMLAKPMLFLWFSIWTTLWNCHIGAYRKPLAEHTRTQSSLQVLFATALGTPNAAQMHADPIARGGDGLRKKLLESGV